MHDLRRAFIHCGLIAIKLDMEPAYDHMSWNFFEKALVDFGFYAHWVARSWHTLVVHLLLLSLMGTHQTSFALWLVCDIRLSPIPLSLHYLC